MADALTAKDVIVCAQKWLTRLTPFFTATERRQAGCQHRLFFTQVECCDNLIFHRRAAVDRLEQRLLDANRTIGQPKKITVIFGRKITQYHHGKLQTVIEDLDLPNPVIRSHYKNGFIKQYVRDRRILRTEPATNNVFEDYGVRKAVENLPQLRQKLGTIIDNYFDVQQDILETFVDRGQFQRLGEPTVLPNGKRVPGLKPNHRRQLALMQALVRFSQLAAGGTFSTPELHPHAAAALGCSTADYKLGSLRYELSKLRAKGLVKKIPHSRRYRLTREGYQVCLVYLKIAERALFTPTSLRSMLMSQNAPPKNAFLYPRVAIEQARRLTLHRFFPEKAVLAAADELRRLCRGGMYRGEYWPPERQAVWLVDVASEWSEWLGIGGLSNVFAQRFPLPEPGNSRRRRTPSPTIIGPLFE